LEYPNQNIRSRHYGKIIEKIIEKTSEMEEGASRDLLVAAISTHLKKSFLMWNRDSVEDDQIFQDLGRLSDGKLKPAEGMKLAAVTDVVGQSFSQQTGKKFHRKQQKQNK